MMTTAEAMTRGIPRWMALSHLSEDLDQIAALVAVEYATPAQRRAALGYYVRCLRRDQWERRPTKPVKRPACLRPSKRARGYRTDSRLKREARMKLDAMTRRAIASAGQAARKRGRHES